MPASGKGKLAGAGVAAGIAGVATVLATAPFADASGAATDGAQANAVTTRVSTVTNSLGTYATTLVESVPDTSSPSDSSSGSTSTASTGSSSSSSGSSSSSSSGSTSGSSAGETSPETPSSGDTTTSETPKPDYGSQKYRVGVRVKDGSYVPDGTTTAGTTLHVKITDQAGNEVPGQSFDCVTEDDTPMDTTDPTYCPGLSITDLRTAARRNGVTPQVTTEPGSSVPFHVYELDAGYTATITQTDVQPNLVIDSGTGVVAACTVDVPILERRVAAESATCSDDPTDVIFDDPGLPPVATDDSATTSENEPVSIAIDGNDTPKAPVQQVQLVSGPQHGKVGLGVTDSGAARRAASIGGYAAQYTPAKGFDGVDSFKYSITTANGTATATVRIKVVGVDDPTLVPPTSETRGIDPTQSRRPDSRRDSRLADTGLPGNALVEYSIALLLAGAGATVAGVRRRRGRHSR